MVYTLKYTPCMSSRKRLEGGTRANRREAASLETSWRAPHVLDLKTHTASLDDAPAMYEKFQKKEDGCIKVVLQP